MDVLAASPLAGATGGAGALVALLGGASVAGPPAGAGAPSSPCAAGVWIGLPSAPASAAAIWAEASAAVVLGAVSAGLRSGGDFALGSLGFVLQARRGGACAVG